MKRVSNFPCPPIEAVEKFVNEICSSARYEVANLQSIYNSFKDNDSPEAVNDRGRLSRAISRLNAIGLIDRYDNIETSQYRGLKHSYEPGPANWGQCTDLKPNGKESASINMWSGMTEYTENPVEMHTS